MENEDLEAKQEPKQQQEEYEAAKTSDSQEIHAEKDKKREKEGENTQEQEDKPAAEVSQEQVKEMAQEGKTGSGNKELDERIEGAKKQIENIDKIRNALQNSGNGQDIQVEERQSATGADRFNVKTGKDDENAQIDIGNDGKVDAKGNAKMAEAASDGKKLEVSHNASISSVHAEIEASIETLGLSKDEQQSLKDMARDQQGKEGQSQDSLVAMINEKRGLKSPEKSQADKGDKTQEIEQNKSKEEPEKPKSDREKIESLRSLPAAEKSQAPAPQKQMENSKAPSMPMPDRGGRE